MNKHQIEHVIVTKTNGNYRDPSSLNELVEHFLKNNEGEEVEVKFKYNGDVICIYSYDIIYLEPMGPTFFIDNAYELDIDKRDFLLYVDIYKRNHTIDKLLE